MAVRTTGRYSGRHPAITALAAILSTVASPWRGGRTTDQLARIAVGPAQELAHGASVGGTIGSPSVQPRS